MAPSLSRLVAPVSVRSQYWSRIAAIACLGLAGCGGEPAPPPAKAPTKQAAPPAKPAVKAPPGHIARPNLERALAEGPPWLLRRVMYEESIGKGGKFLGWKLTGLPEEWSDIDLKPGDVVSQVNGKALETPDQAWEAWKSAGRARELRVRVDRDGVSREVVIPIDGEPSAAVVRALESDSPPPRQPNRSKSVTSIGTDSPPGEDPEGWESY